MSYSKDLRERAVKYYKPGHTLKETSEIFGAGINTISQWVKKYKETGGLSNKPLKRGFKKIDPEKLALFLEENPDAFLRETAEEFGCSIEAVRKAIKRLGITRKKKTLRYYEQKEGQVKEYLEKTADINEENIVYIDETGINSYLYREYAYPERGKKVYGKIKGRKFKRTNIIAAKYGKQIIAPMQYGTTMAGGFFEGWFEGILLPGLPKDAVIVMDNASFHQKKQLDEIAGNNNITLIFLPPYSSELNPIEKVWANMKKFLRNSLHKFSSLDDAIYSFFQVE